MKRSRELEIMMNALKDAGVPCTPQIHDAVARGLRNIRAEKFKERNKQKKNCPAARPGGVIRFVKNGQIASLDRSSGSMSVMSFAAAARAMEISDVAGAGEKRRNK